MLLYILLATFLASGLSLFLVAILLLSKTLIQRFSFYLVSFAAGALLATGFLDTMPEAVKLGGEKVFLWVTIGFAVFFLIERMFFFLHHHDEEEMISLPTPLLLVGDTLHNFIDGVSIAATFLISVPLGLITSLAVFVHEIPHELGDFGVLIHKGWGRGAVFWFNAATGLAAFLGAILAFYLGRSFENLLPLLLSITTANFIYLASVDLLPEIHHKTKGTPAFNYIFSFFFGIFIIAALMKFIS